MRIIIDINDAVVAAHSAAFLKASPIPDDNLDGVADFTPNQWVREYLVRILKTQIRIGYIILRNEQHNASGINDGDFT